jgi:hypothetical protein
MLRPGTGALRSVGNTPLTLPRTERAAAVATSSGSSLEKHEAVEIRLVCSKVAAAKGPFLEWV